MAKKDSFIRTYWVVKEVGLLTRTFEPILSTSTNGSSLVTLAASGGSQTVYAHTTPSSGALAIIENWGNAATLKLTWKNKNITMPSTGAGWQTGSKRWCYFVSDVPVTSNTTIDYSATGILTIKKYGTKNYVVLFGPGGASGEIAFAYKNTPAVTPASPWVWNQSAKRASLIFTYPPVDSVGEVSLSDGAGQTVNLLIMDTTQAIRKTWITDAFLASGPQYVDENNTLQFPAGEAGRFSLTTPENQRL